MSKLDQPSRSKLVAWLAGFCRRVRRCVLAHHLAVGFRAHRLHTATPNRPIGSAANTLGLHVQPIGGGWNLQRMCHAGFGTTSTCDVYGQMLDEVLRFAGDNQPFALEIQIDGTYAGPGKYELPPWPRPLGTAPDVPKVAMFAIGVFWQSVSGVLTVTGGDGRSGALNISLQTSNGTTIVPGPTINVIGSWRCS